MYLSWFFLNTTPPISKASKEIPASKRSLGIDGGVPYSTMLLTLSIYWYSGLNLNSVCKKFGSISIL